MKIVSIGLAIVSLLFSEGIEASKPTLNEKINSPFPQEAPPAPCNTGLCTETTSATFQAKSKTIHAMLTFVYKDGELIDVKLHTDKNEKPQ